MAAATDLATGTTTRRAVIRSERFMQWQRELNSNRSIYGVLGDYDKKDDGMIRTYQRKSDNGSRKERPNNQWEDFRFEWFDNNLDVVKPDANEQKEPHDRLESPDCEKIQSNIESDAQSKQNKTSLQPEVDVKYSKQEDASPSFQQNEDENGQSSVKRRRKVLTNNEHEIQRNTACDTKDHVDVPVTRASKRSSRILAKMLSTRESLPQPLRLPKLQVALSRKEIQEDWLKITGQRYSGKPKKSGIIQWGLGLCSSLTCPSSIRYLNGP